MIFLCQNRVNFAKLNAFLYIPHRICYVENNNKLILNDIVAGNTIVDQKFAADRGGGMEAVMKKMKILLLIVVLMLGMATDVSAAARGTNPDNSEYITIDECTRAGSKWITANYPENTAISEIIPIKDLDGTLNGYCINFSTDGQAAGYLVINALRYSDSYIREFAFDGNGIYDQLVINSPAKGNAERALYLTNPFAYAVKYQDRNEVRFYNSDTSVLSEQEEISAFASVSFDRDVYSPAASTLSNDRQEYYDAFFESSDLTSYTSNNNKTISGALSFTPYTMSDLRTGTYKGNCGPTAVTNICGYYRSRGKTNIFKNNRLSDTYDAIVTAVGFDINGEEGTLYENAKGGLITYVESRSYSITLDSYFLNRWSSFKHDFDADKPNLICIRGYKLEDGSWEEVGHMIVGVGYRIMNDGECYVRVYDGWNATSRFIHFGDDALTSFYGTAVDVV